MSAHNVMNVNEQLLEFLALKSEQQKKTVKKALSKMYQQVAEMYTRILRASRGQEPCKDCDRRRERIKHQKMLLTLQRSQIYQANEILQARSSLPVPAKLLDDMLGQLDRLTSISKVLATQHVELYTYLSGALACYKTLVGAISGKRHVLSDYRSDSLLRLTTLLYQLQKKENVLLRELKLLKTRVNMF